MKRAGAEALSLLAEPINVQLLETLQGGSLPLMDLREAIGTPAQSTMRVYTRRLIELEVIERNRQKSFPGTTEYSITQSGRQLLRVGTTLKRWLSAAPEGPVQLPSTASKNTLKALTKGWTNNIVRALAAKPLSLTELNLLIPSVSYPALERRLMDMRVAHLIETVPRKERGTPYRLTRWMRESIALIAAGNRWERIHLSEAPAVNQLDVEAAFLLAIPLVGLPEDLSGSCRLAVQVRGKADPHFAGVVIHIDNGRVVSCSSRLGEQADSWVSGKPVSWWRRMNLRGEDGLEIGGNAHLAGITLEALRESLTATGSGGTTPTPADKRPSA